jgi:tRNA-dihydrouridine synthase
LPLLLPADHAARRLYTEMVTTGAMMFGNVPRHLDFDPAEHPIALQLRRRDPALALRGWAKPGATTKST